METINLKLQQFWDAINVWATSPQFYVQLAAIIIAILTAFFIASLLNKRISQFNALPLPEPLSILRAFLHGAGDLFFPVLNILLLGVAVEVCNATVEQAWLIRMVQGLAVVFLLYRLINRYIKQALVSSLFKWIGIPLATFHVFGWLDDINLYLEGISVEIGNIRITASGFLRVLIFGSLLFWLGRLSNATGKQIIRKQETLDISTREVIAKLFEIVLVVVIFILLLQVIGIDLTALVVFGGAVGVGLGFGLQQIASNFISGIIILLDRSISIGDYIELEDGRAGILRELSMRSATLETFDGKDIMVPNETFITTAFINWTHKDARQRYSLNFSVAYNTDLDLLFDAVRKTVASHPQVISGPDVPIEERPDAEIAGFGDSGIDILVEFWMEGIDDGKNRVGADLLHMIWKALKENNIEIPFPQREVRILNPDK